MFLATVFFSVLFTMSTFIYILLFLVLETYLSLTDMLRAPNCLTLV